MGIGEPGRFTDHDRARGTSACRRSAATAPGAQVDQPRGTEDGGGGAAEEGEGEGADVRVTSSLIAAGGAAAGAGIAAVATAEPQAGQNFASPPSGWAHWEQKGIAGN